MSKRDQPRDRFDEVGPAIRESYARMAAEKRKDGDWRIWGAVICLVGSFSRLEDRVTIEQIARVAGRDERTVQRALPRIAETDAITYERGGGLLPGGEHGRPSSIGLPRPKGDNDAVTVRSGSKGDKTGASKGDNDAVTHREGSREERPTSRTPTESLVRAREAPAANPLDEKPWGEHRETKRQMVAKLVEIYDPHPELAELLREAAVANYDVLNFVNGSTFPTGAKLHAWLLERQADGWKVIPPTSSRISTTELDDTNGSVRRRGQPRTPTEEDRDVGHKTYERCVSCDREIVVDPVRETDWRCDDCRERERWSRDASPGEQPPETARA